MERRRRSAGILLYRRPAPATVEVLLAHPGGPYYVRRNEGIWTIPKGQMEEGEDGLTCARREFREEMGFLPPDAPFLYLGVVRQKGGKYVEAWAVEWPAGDVLPPLDSITFEVEWPPRSGRMRSYPEVDRAQFFSPAEARPLMIGAQFQFVRQLLQLLGLPDPEGDASVLALPQN